MECNLEPSDRSLRMITGVFLTLGALVAGTLAYLELIESWWYIVTGVLALLGIGAILSAAAGKCMLRSVIEH